MRVPGGRKDSLGRPRTEEEIGAALRRTDARAIEELHELYGRAVLGYLLQEIRDRAAAEDVHQQVFTELWSRSERYDPKRGTLFTWVMTVARSRAIDYLRRRRPEPHDPSHAAELAEGDGERDAAEGMIERWHVAGLLERIPSDEASMLKMRFYEELTQREISERTGIALGTVKMRMVQALERLRELIEGEEL